VTRDENHVADEDTEDMRINDRLWIRSKILLQLDEKEETHRSPHRSLQIWLWHMHSQSLKMRFHLR